MIIYEVAVAVDPEIMTSYVQWMSEEHIPDVLKCPGFVKAEFLLEPEGKPKVRILYYVKDATFLRKYLADFAPGLRQKSAEKWKNHFQAERSIWALYGTMAGSSK